MFTARKQITHVYAILDRSGSMGGLEKSTLEGYNGFVKKLKGSSARLTTVLFDDQFETPVKNVHIADVKPMNDKTYFVRGGTALVDAVCTTLKGTKIPKADKALVLIITDGEENSSREYDTKDMKALVEKLEGQGNWTFTYIGANQDAWAVAQKYGFAHGNVATYKSTVSGTAQTYTTMAVNTAAFAASGSANTRNYFSQEDQETLEEVK